MEVEQARIVVLQIVYEIELQFSASLTRVCNHGENCLFFLFLSPAKDAALPVLVFCRVASV